MAGMATERGILFSGPMVSAILDGRKTQTRRIVKAECPYGRVGDRLWVRERWSPGNGVAIADAAFSLTVDGAQKYRDGTYLPPLGEYATGAFDRVRWRPSIHMPRWASRITLEVTEVRAERLQDISEADAKAEGVSPAPFCKTGRADGFEHVEAYEDLWDSINGKTAPWVSNPWVWVVSFRAMT